MAAGDGLVTMTPTSIAVAGAGSSASINADGGVDFTSATSLSLNGVFTSSFDNYLIVVKAEIATSGADLNSRLRVSGSDASGTNYTTQLLNVNSSNATPVTAGRSTSQTSSTITYVDTSSQGVRVQYHVYGPALAQPTAFRSVVVRDASVGPTIYEYANTHSLSTAYDGMTFLVSAGSITGNVAVFGYEE